MEKLIDFTAFEKAQKVCFSTICHAIEVACGRRQQEAVEHIFGYII